MCMKPLLQNWQGGDIDREKSNRETQCGREERERERENFNLGSDKHRNMNNPEKERDFKYNSH